jgi:hypothetical protein
VSKILLLLTLLVLAACGGEGDGPPACSTGTSKDGAVSQLRLAVEGHTLQGTYDAPVEDGAGLRYQIEGRAVDGHLDTTWVVGVMTLHITGRYTATEVTLDDPRNEFGTTRFVAGCS